MGLFYATASIQNASMVAGSTRVVPVGANIFIMRPDAPPDTHYAFGYRQSPRSGNEINGLGERTKRRARHVFHNATGEKLDWEALDGFFSFINPWGVVRHMLINSWQLRRQEGPVATDRAEVVDPGRAALEIKAEASRLGASLVGITDVGEDALYEGFRRTLPARDLHRAGDVA